MNGGEQQPGVSQGFINTCLVGAAVIIGLALFPGTKRFAVWVGIAIVIMLYLRWKRTGGQ